MENIKETPVIQFDNLYGEMMKKGPIQLSLKDGEKTPLWVININTQKLISCDQRVFSKTLNILDIEKDTFYIKGRLSNDWYFGISFGRPTVSKKILALIGYFYLGKTNNSLTKAYTIAVEKSYIYSNNIYLKDDDTVKILVDIISNGTIIDSKNKRGIVKKEYVSLLNSPVLSITFEDEQYLIYIHHVQFVSRKQNKQTEISNAKPDSDLIEL
jgi:hypothetical protein